MPHGRSLHSPLPYHNPDPVMGRPAAATVSVGEFARLTGKTPRTVTGWLADGMPCRHENGERRIVPAEAMAWLLAFRYEAGRASVVTSDEASERVALLRARRQQEELRLEDMRGTLARKEDVERAFDMVHERVRARLLALPAKAAPALVGLRRAVDVQLALEGYVDEVVAEIRGL